MCKAWMIFLALAVWSCNDDPVVTISDPIRTNTLVPDDLNSCFSPEFGIIEDEQFFYELVLGELRVDLSEWITTNNLGYAIEEGSKTVFVYRHLLENNFDIIDDEAEIRIFFQIDENLETFSINSAEDFEKSMCIYAECGVALQSIRGSINGTITSKGKWAVEAEFQIDRFSQEKLIVINETFIF